MINLSLLSDFLVFAKSLHVTQCAEELHVSPSTLSTRIRQLERQMGTKLVRHHGRTLRLTNAGSVLAEHGSRLVREAALTEELVRSEEVGFGGSVRFGCNDPFAVAIAPKVQDFIGQYPNVHVSLQTEGAMHFLDMLRDGDLDLALIAESRVNHSVSYTHLFDVTASAFGPLVQDLPDTVVDLEALKKYPLLLQPSTHNFRRHLDDAFLDRSDEYNVLLESSSRHTLLEWARLGLGLAVLPAHSTFYADFPIASSPLDLGGGSNLTIPMVMAWKKGGSLSPSSERFRDVILALAS
jgi:DNA-binding transcriptional LysR family regulator